MLARVYYLCEYPSIQLQIRFCIFQIGIVRHEFFLIYYIYCIYVQQIFILACDDKLYVVKMRQWAVLKTRTYVKCMSTCRINLILQASQRTSSWIVALFGGAWASSSTRHPMASMQAAFPVLGLHRTGVFRVSCCYLRSSSVQILQVTPAFQQIKSHNPQGRNDLIVEVKCVALLEIFWQVG